MARSRNIKPSIMDNEELAELDPLARLLFVYLWMLADREGRLEDRPKRIAAQALPYDRSADVDALLADLHSAGFIVRYEVGGKPLIQITNFSKHQSPHVRESASALPPMNEGTTKAVPRHNLGDAEASPRSPDSLIPDSLIPDSIVPTSSGASAPSVDSRDVVFTHGLALLTETGTDEPKARRFLGKCVSMHGPDAVSAAVLAAVKNRVGDPIPYVQRVLAGNSAPRASPSGGTRARSIADDLTDRSWAAQ